MTAYRNSNSEVARNLPDALPLIDRVGRIVDAHDGGAADPQSKPAAEPDPAVAPDSGQFFRVVLLDHLETCSEDDCYQDTRCAVESQDTGPIACCPAHVHVAFADWMVGA